MKKTQIVKTIPSYRRWKFNWWLRQLYNINMCWKKMAVICCHVMLFMEVTINNVWAELLLMWNRIMHRNQGFFHIRTKSIHKLTSETHFMKLLYSKIGHYCLTLETFNILIIPGRRPFFYAINCKWGPKLISSLIDIENDTFNRCQK